MQILLPPSETKRVGGSGILTPNDLRASSALGDARERVRAALEALSREPEAAAKPLKLGVKNRAELEYNLELGESGVLPAIERYTGVLYDALDVATLDGGAREWLDTHVLVQSALFGLVGAGDPIPAYRLSASSRLPGLGTSLKAAWRVAHADDDWAERGWILDLRSKDYAELAPLPDGAGASLRVAQRGPNGEARALNHFNKAAKGDLVRRLAVARPEISGEDDLVAWAAEAGIDLKRRGLNGQLTLLTELGAPASAANHRATTGAR
ncbi:peroxide stress protein YaaA [Leucobacter coleopterorum]|uniref:Peroxide stress protein YaaA n=1 Tax=Leucobacter coleopterorum TaxID=2714933 RepID=A0ABX6JXM7_9MICO|nr:peroxide stress protein YaaA [Leucobacter coleopterorum]QIM19007.1 peroxide stress protein YaaA [Leucobacter coleopterorum]